MQPRSRILLMGGPGSGKSYQLLKVAEYLEEKGTKVHCIDMEDKLEATMAGLGSTFGIDLHVAIYWEELKKAIGEVESKAKENEWIFADRIDLAWPAVQRWFTQMKYKEELADRMLRKAQEMTKPSMFIPRFDQGSWQVINEEYESIILTVLYKLRCNVLLTAGIKGVDDNSPHDIFGNLGVLPRGQKELAHQPHSVFLLTQRKVSREIIWLIQTAKDLPGRDYFDDTQLFDFSLQYLELYCRGENK